MRNIALCIVLVVLVGCSTSTNPVTTESSAQSLPEDVPRIEGVAECVPIKAEESLLSVSPEGFAWLAAQTNENTQFRVLDPLNMGASNERVLDLMDVTSLQAWSDVDASLVAGEQLWRLDDFARVNLNVQTSGVASLCGALMTDGFVLSSQQLIERRESSWWRTTLKSNNAPKRLLTRRGECLGPDGVLWATGAQGMLWRVDDGVAKVHAQFGSLVDAVSHESGVFVLDGSILWAGSANGVETWASWNFGDKNPTQLTASTRAVWVLAGKSLWRLTQDKWQRLDVSEQPVRVLAYDDGVWWATSTQVCHHKTGPGVRVEGVRPFERTRQSQVMLRLSLFGGAGSLEARINGQPLTLQEAGMDTWQVTVPLDRVGWHQLEVQTTQGVRSLPVERLAPLELSWSEDIQPLYQVHCSECHDGPDALSVDLSTHEQWVSQSERIKTFVVDAQTMPPPASRKDAWSDDAVEAINQWLNGSQNP